MSQGLGVREMSFAGPNTGDADYDDTTSDLSGYFFTSGSQRASLVPARSIYAARPSLAGPLSA